MTDLSYQLYSSRNFPPLADTLRMVAEAGYTQVEGFGGLYQEAANIETLKAGLAETGLSMPTGHIGFDTLQRAPGEVIAMAEALGLKAVFVPAIGDRDRDAAGWAKFGRDLAEAGKPLQDAGLQFGWHNHAFEFQDLGGQDLPLDLILAGSDDLWLEFDVAWAVVGGQDPFDWIAKYGDRILSVHVKDIAPKGTCEDEDGWADVGHGTLDWAALLGKTRAAGATYFIMEHDNPSDDKRFATRSLAATRGFLGAPA